MLTYEVIIRDNGFIEYQRHDEYHRKNQPARIWSDGLMSWWEYGQRHRNDGPSYIGYTVNQYHRRNILYPES